MKFEKVLPGFVMVAVVCLGPGVATPVRATTVDTLVISEVFYDAAGGDNALEWIELFNGGMATVTLDGWSLAFGGSGYTVGVVGLEGSVEPDDYFVIGGPVSSSVNGQPVFDQAIDIQPDLQNSGATADAVALFHLDPSTIVATSVPFDAVIYGGSNNSGLLDSSGRVDVVHVADAASGESIERLSEFDWRVRSNPQPGTGSLNTQVAAETDSFALLLAGLAMWVGGGSVALRRVVSQSPAGVGESTAERGVISNSPGITLFRPRRFV